MAIDIEIDIPDPKFAAIFELLLRSVGQISRAQAADLMQMGLDEFSRVFVEHHQITFRKMRQEVRIAIGACLLQQPHLRVSEIANFVGYSDTREFRRVFRKTIGPSPVRFRLAASGQAPMRHEAGQCVITVRNLPDQLE